MPGLDGASCSLTTERLPYSSGSLIWDKHHSQQGLVSSDTAPRSCCEIVQKEVDLKSRNGVSQVQGSLEKCLCLLLLLLSAPPALCLQGGSSPIPWHSKLQVCVCFLHVELQED